MVQGVFFRAFVEKNARELGIKGWVKNTEDYVEILAQGEKKDLDELIERCKKGSPASKVEEVKAKETEIKEEFNDFEIRY